MIDYNFAKNVGESNFGRERFVIEPYTGNMNTFIPEFDGQILLAYPNMFTMEPKMALLEECIYCGVIWGPIAYWQNEHSYLTVAYDGNETPLECFTYNDSTVVNDLVYPFITIPVIFDKVTRYHSDPRALNFTGFRIRGVSSGPNN